MRATVIKHATTVLCVLCTLFTSGRAAAQEKLTQDTMQCHIIGANFGTVFPSRGGSVAFAPDGTKSKTSTMNGLYKMPFLNFGVNAVYKYKTNWLVFLDGDFFFGSDNLRGRDQRMSHLFTRDSIIIGTNGTDAVTTCYNRGFSVRAGGGKIIRVSKKNPNSGVLLKLTGGWIQQQTVFNLNEVHAPQIEGRYAKLYDHQRMGGVLTEAVGFWFMSNNLNLVNFYVAFELSQSWMKSTRDFTIDNLEGLSGKDNNLYFDLTYTLKFCWMFPLKGKTAYDYYYY